MADFAGNSQSGELAEYPYGSRPSSAHPISLRPESAPREAPSHTAGPLIFAIGLGFIFASANFAVCPLMAALQGPGWGALPVFVLFGAILAQAGLLSAALVFGGGSFWRRMIVCWAMAAFLWGCWAAGRLAVGLAGVWPFNWWAELRFCVLSIPLIGLAIQSPLWVARVYFDWRLTRACKSASGARPLSISDYLTGTAITAVSITCARLAPRPGWNDSGYWPVWAIVLVCIAAASLLSVVPAMLAMFHLRDQRIGFGVLLAYGLIAGVMTLATIFYIFGPPGGSGWQVVAVLIIFVSLVGILGVGMKAARDLGFELLLGRWGTR